MSEIPQSSSFSYNISNKILRQKFDIPEEIKDAS
jgi:hypothetical protein